MISEQFLSQEFVKAHPADAARILDQLLAEETAQFLQEIPPNLAAAVTKLMTPLTAANFLEMMDTNQAAAIIAETPMEVAADLLRRLDTSKRPAVLQTLPNEISGAFERLLQYPENTAGTLMNPQAFTLYDDMTIKEALKLIIRRPRHVYYHIPVIDRDHKFVGLTDTRELMLAKPDGLISAVTHTGVRRLSPTLNREGILSHPDWQIYHELPVVDQQGVFLGLIGYQIIRRLERESQQSAQPGSAYDAGKALGELYWIGMSAFFKGATQVVTPSKGTEEDKKGGH